MDPSTRARSSSVSQAVTVEIPCISTSTRVPVGTAGSKATQTPGRHCARAARPPLSLFITTASHVLVNFALNGAVSIPGAVLPSVLVQAGVSSDEEKDVMTTIIVLSQAAGNIAGTFAGGALMDSFPSHWILLITSIMCAANMTWFPFANGIVQICCANGIVFFGMGIVDCSFGTLTWSVLEAGISDSAPYLNAKSFGTALGMVFSVVLTSAIGGKGTDFWTSFSPGSEVAPCTFRRLCLVLPSWLRRTSWRITRTKHLFFNRNSTLRCSLGLDMGRP